MVPTGTRKRSVILVSLLGAVLITVTIALNISWIVVNWQTWLLLLVGIVSFAVLIVGLALNTGFLIREIRRSEQHDAFIHAVTHELKTPLASIGLYLQTLRQRDVDRPKQHEFIDIMRADADRLQSTIDQILLAGKTSATRRVVKPTDVDIRDVVTECLQLAGQRHHLVNGELRFFSQVPDTEEIIVPGDREEILAAVSNLIDNAIKYSRQEVSVEVGLARLGARRVVVSVRDRGVGITRDELKHIFRRFYRIPEPLSARVHGTGLGLSIVNAVARRHRGRADATSGGAGKGSTFTLEMPLKRS